MPIVMATLVLYSFAVFLLNLLWEPSFVEGKNLLYNPYKQTIIHDDYQLFRNEQHRNLELGDILTEDHKNVGYVLAFSFDR